MTLILVDFFLRVEVGAGRRGGDLNFDSDEQL